MDVTAALVGLIVLRVDTSAGILELAVAVDGLLCHSFHIGYEFNYLNICGKNT